MSSRPLATDFLAVHDVPSALRGAVQKLVHLPVDVICAAGAPDSPMPTQSVSSA
jgi:hypothetical protein